jgi:flagellar hook-associated protein FlgK
MTVKLSTGLRNNLVGSTGFSGSFADGVIEIYSGAQPVSSDAAVTGTLLGTVTLASGAFTPGTATNGLTFAAAANGAVSKSGVWSFNGFAAGVAGWFRLKANAADSGALSTTALRLDGSIATSGADLNLSNITIAVGAPNTIDTFSFTVPAQ